MHRTGERPGPYPCEACPWERLAPADELALGVWSLLAPVRELGLAPMLLGALNLQMTTEEWVQFIRRIGIIHAAETTAAMKRAQQRADRGEDAGADPGESA